MKNHTLPKTAEQEAILRRHSALPESDLAGRIALLDEFEVLREEQWSQREAYLAANPRARALRDAHLARVDALIATGLYSLNGEKRQQAQRRMERHPDFDPNDPIMANPIVEIVKQLKESHDRGR